MKTMKELANEDYCIDLWDLWDNLCNELPYHYTGEEIMEEFAKRYDVAIEEVREYFDGVEY